MKSITENKNFNSRLLKIHDFVRKIFMITFDVISMKEWFVRICLQTHPQPEKGGERWKGRGGHLMFDGNCSEKSLSIKNQDLLVTPLADSSHYHSKCRKKS